MKRVPWKSFQEWKDVKSKLVSQNDEDLIRAYEIMLMWKARCPNLPANVECTLGIVQVLVQDILVQDKNRVSLNGVLFYEESNLQLSYSTALLRFVNHVSASTSLLGDTLYVAAHKKNIPDWVINLRHDIAHSGSIPPLQLLESGVRLAKQWLLENYWETQEGDMSEVEGSSMKGRATHYTPSLLQNLLTAGVAAWWACRVAIRQKNLFVSQISDNDWCYLISFVEYLGTNKLVRNEEFVKPIQNLVMSATEQRSRKNETKGALPIIAKRILKALFVISNKEEKLSKCLLNAMLEAGFLQTAGDNLRVWAPMLKVLHKMDSLKCLVEHLLFKLASGTTEEAKCAVGWLQALAPTLENQRAQWKSFMQCKTKDNGISVSKPTLRDDALSLPLRKPAELHIELLRPALLAPTSITSEIVTHYLKLLNPELPKKTRVVVKSLVGLYTKDLDVDEVVAQNIDLHNLTTYSIGDLTSQRVDDIQLEPLTKEKCNANLWRKISIDADLWRRTPFGLLPHQIEPDLELPNLVWREIVPPSRKRKASD